MYRFFVPTFLAIFGLSVGLVGSQLAFSDELTASDGNSTITVDPESDVDPSDLALGQVGLGLRRWEVDERNHLFTQWFWVRIGEDDPEEQLQNFLSLEHAENHDPNTIHLTYEGDLIVDVLYTLSGGAAGSGFSELKEKITVTNDSGDDIDFLTLFEYSDFDLNGLADGETAEFVAPGTMIQREGSTTATVTSLSPDPSHWEISEFGVMLGKFEDGDSDTLADGTTPFGPADITHAFQYELRNFSDGDSVEISKLKRIEGGELGPFEGGGPVVPEPASSLLFGVGLAGAAALRRKKKIQPETAP